MRKPIVLAAMLVCGLAAVPAWAGIDRIKSGPTCSGNCALSGYKAKVRRGLPYTWVFTGSFLDGADRVVTGGNGITGSVLTKSFGEATVQLLLAPTTPLGGRAITVQAGNQILGAFALDVGHLGRVDSITPETIRTGQRSVVRILGRDIEGGQLGPLPSAYNSRVVQRAADEIRLELNLGAELPSGGATIQLFEKHGDGSQTPWQKAPRLTVQSALATGSEGCQTYPSSDLQLRPGLSAPTNGFLFAPLSSTQTMRQINFSWQRLASNYVVDKYVLEYRLRGSSSWKAVDALGTLTSQTANLGKGVWDWRVRIGNCGQSAPYSDTWWFTIQ